MKPLELCYSNDTFAYLSTFWCKKKWEREREREREEEFVCAMATLRNIINLKIIASTVFEIIIIIIIIDRFYIALFSALEQTLRSHEILHEWIAFYSAFFNIHRSGVLTALAWLVPQETAAISARSVYTIQPCTMSLHAKPHTCMTICSPTFSTLSDKNTRYNMFKKVIYIWQLTIYKKNNGHVYEKQQCTRKKIILNQKFILMVFFL